MKPFHSLFPELAQREVRCLHIGPAPEAEAHRAPVLPSDEYLYVECYCGELACDCRRVLLQVLRRGAMDTVLANIVYGWDKESFYRKRIAWEGDVDQAARRTVRGELDPLLEQSEFAEQLLQLFQQLVLD